MLLRDRRGRLWSHRLDVAAAVRMRDLAGVDVMQLGLTQSLPGSRAALVDAAYALLLPEAQRHSVSDREFGRLLRGRLWGWTVSPSDLADELLAELAAFFASPKLSPGEPKGDVERELTAADLWGDIYALAGLVGVDPGPLTYGELVALADSRRKHDWARTAELMALTFNLQVDREHRKPAAAFDPTGGLGAESTGSIEITADNLFDVAAIFCRGQ
ncbi:hypothetical protein [Stratiformator vulcanicus]|uniref:Uncharacterized protein n=1 Tax=Stratiformator vulcanicus TaxID=2527980 RepID=A0A517R753_9PLAN|nr:hypothetical protein [Stratiformator vulcanicus]QDT39724.1 hypothetical protein Pan189_41330 [Stratiformator vulcanicus]